MPWRHPLRRSRLDTWGAFIVVFGVWGVAMVVFLVAVLLAPTSLPEGQCAGLGFGCVPTPRDGLILIGYLVVLPASIAWWVLGIVVTPSINLIRPLRWWVKGLIAVAVCASLELLLALALNQFY